MQTPARPRIINAFAIPVVETYFPRADELNPKLKALFLEREKEGDKHRNVVPTPTVQVEIFESDFQLFGWPEPEVQALRDFCFDTLARVIAQLNGYDAAQMNRLRVFSHTWFHITRYGGYISNHNHPMASWSGVYCVDPGEAVAEKPDSGVLRFADPRSYGTMYMDPGNSHLRDPFAFGSLNFRFRAGQFILFPSYLMHEVAPFFGSDERITVAFNAWIQEQPASA